MLDLCLRADSEAALKAAIPFAVSAEGEWIVASHQWAFDPIGAVVATPVVYDLGTIPPSVVSEAVMADGWHANLRLLDDALAGQVPEAVRITPNSPSRVWA